MINNNKFRNVLIIGSGQSVNKDTLLDLLCESVYRMTELRIKTLNRSISIGEEKQNEVRRIS